MARCVLGPLSCIEPLSNRDEVVDELNAIEFNMRELVNAKNYLDVDMQYGYILKRMSLIYDFMSGGFDE